MTSDTPTKPIFEFVNRRPKLLTILAFVVAILLGVAGVAKSATTDNPEEADFNPSGDRFDAQDRAEETFDFDEPVLGAQFIVEAAEGSGGDALTRDALLEFMTNADALQADEESIGHLTSAFDNDLGVEVDGIYSIAHAVDDELPGGLVDATDADVKLALASVLAEDSATAGLRSTLSQRAENEPGTIGDTPATLWTAPAFIAEVRYQRDSFDIEDPDGSDDVVDYEYTIEAETWLRDAQDLLQGDESDITVLGLAIDSTLTDEEEGMTAAPYILLAIIVILFLVGVMLRSYFASAIVVVGLGLTFLAYLGLWNLTGIARSLFITLVVPITVIAFGVDYFVHGLGRCREEQQAGVAADRAYPVGLSRVAGAVLLALLTSALAFLSNVVSGIPAIAEFGVAAAMGLAVAYLLLGILGPKVVLRIEEGLGPRATRGHLHLGSRLGFLAMALVGGAVVMMCVVQPPVGTMALLIVFIPLFVYLPFRMSRRRNQRAAEAGHPVEQRVPTPGRGVAAAGTVVHFMARWRVVTVPLVIVLAIAGVIGATHVSEEFEVSDFISSETDLVRGLELRDEHFQSSTGGDAFLLVEGDITDPATLVAMDAAVERIDADETAADEDYLARDFDGELITAPNAATIVQQVLASPAGADAVEASTGAAVTDTDGNGYPDDPEQVEAVLTHALAEGVTDVSGRTVLRSDEVARAVALGDPATTVIRVAVPTVTDESIISAAREGLDAAGDQLEASTADAVTTIATGETITTRSRLDAITGAMVLAIPVAFILCALVALLFMRSVRYALVAVAPMLIVVGWIFGFMYLFDYSVNPVTATIAAIAIGVGVDYAMHFTIRFRQEFEGEPSRFPALRRTGEATGVALVVSAFTSIGGFAALALTPMPVFAGFGVLMTATILFSLLVALLVLPSLLLLVTPSRKGDTRRFLEESLTGGVAEYDPHTKETAHREYTQR